MEIGAVAVAVKVSLVVWTLACIVSLRQLLAIVARRREVLRDHRPETARSLTTAMRKTSALLALYLLGITSGSVLLLAS